MGARVFVAAGIVGFALAASPASAASIVNDPPPGNLREWSGIFAHDPFGQSFTAEDAQIASVALWVDDGGGNAVQAPGDLSVDISLYEGSGFAGTLLGTRSFTSLTPGFSGFADVDFSDVALVVGNPYTIRITNDTVRWGILATTNTYAGGILFSRGNALTGNDMLFRVLVPPTVPEPGSLALGTFALGALLARARRTAICVLRCLS